MNRFLLTTLWIDERKITLIPWCKWYCFHCQWHGWHFQSDLFCDPLEGDVLHTNQAAGSLRTVAQTVTNGDPQYSVCCTFMSSQSRRDGCADVLYYRDWYGKCGALVKTQVLFWSRLKSVGQSTGSTWSMQTFTAHSLWWLCHHFPHGISLLSVVCYPYKSYLQNKSYYTILLVELTAVFIYSLTAVKYWSLKIKYDHASSSILT